LDFGGWLAEARTPNPEKDLEKLGGRTADVLPPLAKWRERKDKSYEDSK
jgi:hypothetical protein